MKYIFNVKETIVIDSDRYDDCDTEEKAWSLIDDGFGRLLDRDVMLVETR